MSACRGWGRMAPSGLNSGQDPHDVAFFHHQQLFAIKRDFCTGPLAEQNLVTGFYSHLDQFTAVFACAVTASNDFAFSWLFFCGIRDDQTIFQLLKAQSYSSKPRSPGGEARPLALNAIEC